MQNVKPRQMKKNAFYNCLVIYEALFICVHPHGHLQIYRILLRESVPLMILFTNELGLFTHLVYFILQIIAKAPELNDVNIKHFNLFSMLEVHKNSMASKLKFISG